MQSTPTSWKYKLCTYRYLHNTKKGVRKVGSVKLREPHWHIDVDTKCCYMFVKNLPKSWMTHFYWSKCHFRSHVFAICLWTYGQKVGTTLQGRRLQRNVPSKRRDLDHFSPFSNGWNMLKYRYVSKISASKIQWFPFKIFGSLGLRWHPNSVPPSLHGGVTIGMDLG